MLTLPDPRLHLVYDKQDDVKTAAFVNDLASPADGRLVVDVTPDGRNLDWLAVDIERGLGKNPHLSGAGRDTSDRWSRIHAWLIGGQVETVFVSRIQLLDERRLAAAIGLAVACGVDLWLIAQQDPLPERMAELLAEWPFEEVELLDFRRRWRSTRPRKPATEVTTAEEAFPTVPLDEFVWFRAACRALLAPEEFVVVDEAFQAAAASTLAWIDASDAIGEDEVVKLVGGLIGPCRSLNEAVTTLRAAQVAFFWRRYLLKVNLDCVLAAYAIAEQSALDEETTAKLGSYAAARYPVAAVIALGCEMSPKEIALLNLRDVSTTPEGISIAGRGSLPPQTTRLVLPHLVERLMGGASSDAPLFVVHTTNKAKRDQRVTDRAIERLLLCILKETGVRITHARSYTGLRGNSANWRWREGLSIQPLEPTFGAA